MVVFIVASVVVVVVVVAVTINVAFIGADFRLRIDYIVWAIVHLVSIWSSQRSFSANISALAPSWYKICVCVPRRNRANLHIHDSGSVFGDFLFKTLSLLPFMVQWALQKANACCTLKWNSDQNRSNRPGLLKPNRLGRENRQAKNQLGRENQQAKNQLSLEIKQPIEATQTF